MIDVMAEQLRTFAQASKLLPDRPNVSTFWRWHRHGVKGVQLETVVIGGRRYTSVEALQRFVVRLSSVEGKTDAGTGQALGLQTDGVDQQLDEAGL